jgi:hypothetical protein
MAIRRKNAPASDEVTLVVSRREATELLALLQHAEGLVNTVKPQQTQNFLGGLIKKVKRAAGKSVKSAK